MKNYSLRTEDLDIVNKSDLPDTSSFVTTNTAQNISGIKTIYNDTAAPYFILKNHYSGMWTVKGGSATTPSGGYTLTLPNKTGTIALTSDLPSSTNFVTIADTQTITGLKIFNDTGSGAIALKYNNGTYSTYFHPTSETQTSNLDIRLPNKSGTVATTSDLPTFSYSNNVLTITY